MRTSWSALLSWLVLPVLVLGSAREARSELRTAVAERVRESVVKVYATFGTGSSARKVAASGFCWHAAGHVVTSLHVVAGARRIRVYSQQAGATRSARVTKVLRRADLALLKLSVDDGHPMHALPLLPTGQRPEGGSSVYAIGYPRGQEVADDTPLTVRSLASVVMLKQIVPQRVRERLARMGMPAPHLEVLNLAQSLQPGHSGAPIVNETGQVVAVGDGGLEAGTADRSWGIPATQLDDLLASDESTEVEEATDIKTLFAADLDVASPDVETPVVRFAGGRRLQQVKTRSLAEISMSTDDPVGLGQILESALMRMPEEELEQLRFDVYAEAASGAVVVVPAGATLVANEHLFTATIGDVRMYILLREYPSDEAADLGSQRFEFGWMGNPQLWVPDNDFTYPAPRQRDIDGMQVRRRAYAGAARMDDWGQPIWDRYAFETFVLRNGVLLASAGVNTRFRQPGAMEPAFVRRWASVVLAVHLTTFAL